MKTLPPLPTPERLEHVQHLLEVAWMFVILVLTLLAVPVALYLASAH